MLGGKRCFPAYSGMAAEKHLEMERSRRKLLCGQLLIVRPCLYVNLETRREVRKLFLRWCSQLVALLCRVAMGTLYIYGEIWSEQTPHGWNIQVLV